MILYGSHYGTCLNPACPPYGSTTGQALYALSRGRDDNQHQQQNLSGSRLKPCRDDGRGMPRPYNTQHLPHFLLHTSYFLLHTSYFLLHTSYFTLHTSYFTLASFPISLYNLETQ